jgi:large subunit ribosomal protein L23
MATEARILKRPVITEKMTKLGEKLNRYAFVVDDRCNKLEIKEAVEKFYEGITVTEVRTLRVPAKEKMQYRNGRFVTGRKPGFKKAIVTLAEGDTIDFYSNI